MIGPGIGLVKRAPLSAAQLVGGGSPGWLVEGSTTPAPKYWLTETGGRWLTE